VTATRATHAPLRLAIVTPWFGEDLKGGAEQLAWQLATRLAVRGHAVDVLTTCSRAFASDWSHDHYAPGAYELRGCRVHRFALDDRDAGAFDGANAVMLGVPREELRAGAMPVEPAVAHTFFDNMIRSQALVAYLEEHRRRWRGVIFLPYFYGPVVDGVRAAPENAYLQPCLHDEVYAYLPQVAATIHGAKALLFNSEGEYELALRVYGPGIARKSHVVGSGIEFDANPQPREPAGLGAEPFVLYLGRRDVTKNTAFLVDAFARFKKRRPESPLRLVLAGPGAERFGDADLGVLDLGLVDEAEKAHLLLACEALFQPSTNESFSRVLMEAWAAGRPAAVHAECRATAQVVETTGGGFTAGSADAWASLFERVEDAGSDALAALGARGKSYVDRVVSWDAVIARYEALFRPSAESGAVRRGRRAVHQLLSNFEFGDAISNHALVVRNVLRDEGFDSDIFVRHVNPVVAHHVGVFAPGDIRPDDGLIFHHSIGSELTAHAVGHRGPKCLIYHNITPGEFFAPFRRDFAEILHHGREQLGDIVRSFDFAVGDSLFNALELKHAGFRDAFVLPISPDLSRFDVTPDAQTMRELSRPGTKILFVGRVAPNKKQDDLLRAFDHYLALDPGARLIVAGKHEDWDPYYLLLRDIERRLGIQDSVVFTGHITDAELLACWQNASLFWSMSEHEGFCVPLVEAMWFDVPVFAFRSTAVPETLGRAGAMFEKASGWPALAASAHRLVHDPAARASVLAGQRTRRSAFDPAATHAVIRMIARLLAQRGAPRRPVRVRG
jgi:glycosyltransferase involved in cell wall biosynthesis